MFFAIGDVEVSSYADDNTPYIHEKFPNKLLEKLECASRNVFELFFKSAMNANPYK